MSLSVGIVGLPNVGKSTIFNSLTQAGANCANYPFCTIDPNVGVVPVPDSRLATIREHIESEKIIPTSVDIVDIAGLVKGASQGEGLGNKFLSNIRETDAILMVVRCFEDPDIEHVDRSIDPIRDIEVIQLELILADMETVQQRHNRVARTAKSGDKASVAERALLERMLPVLEQGKPARDLEQNAAELAISRHWHLLSVKPVLYCCNVGETQAAGGVENAGPLVDKVRERANTERSGVVVVSGQIEAELSELQGVELAEMLEVYGLQHPAVHSLTRACYELLGLQSYFTAGPKEIRAWTVQRGATAPQAAGVIHTDFEKGFIRANVYSVADLIEHGTEAAIKSAGKLRSEGKEYVVQDSDVMHFLFN